MATKKSATSKKSQPSPVEEKIKLLEEKCALYEKRHALFEAQFKELIKLFEQSGNELERNLRDINEINKRLISLGPVEISPDYVEPDPFSSSDESDSDNDSDGADVVVPSPSENTPSENNGNKASNDWGDDDGDDWGDDDGEEW